MMVTWATITFLLWCSEPQPFQALQMHAHSKGLTHQAHSLSIKVPMP